MSKCRHGRPPKASYGADSINITREQLARVIEAWELAARHDPSAHNFETPDEKAAYLFRLLSESTPGFDAGKVWGTLAAAQRVDP